MSEIDDKMDNAYSQVARIQKARDRAYRYAYHMREAHLCPHNWFQQGLGLFDTACCACYKEAMDDAN